MILNRSCPLVYIFSSGRSLDSIRPFLLFDINFIIKTFNNYNQHIIFENNSIFKAHNLMPFILNSIYFILDNKYLVYYHQLQKKKYIKILIISILNLTKKFVSKEYKLSKKTLNKSTFISSIFTDWLSLSH